MIKPRSAVVRAVVLVFVLALTALTALTATAPVAPARSAPHAHYKRPVIVLASWYQDSAKACPGYSGIHAWGVAHRSLPCGTRLRLTYRESTVYTRVIDRGPYVGGRSLDLHAPVARALRFSGVDRVKMEARR